MEPNKIPLSMTKSELVKAYYPLPEDLIREEINKIIIKERIKIERFKNCTEKQLKRVKTVLRAEILIFSETYGLPEKFEE